MHPHLAPRAAEYIASLLPSAQAIDVLAELLSESSTVWVRARLLAAAIHSPSACMALGPEVLSADAEEEPWPISHLSAWALHAGGHDWDIDDVSLKLILGSSTYEQLRPALPVVRTTL